MTCNGRRDGSPAGFTDSMEGTDPVNEVKQDVMDRASRFLAYKPRTRQELCRHLREKGVSEEQVRACADVLEDYRLLDDMQYCRMYIESMTDRGRGAQRIRRELRQKGVDAFVIEDAFAEFDDLPDERELALQQAREALADADLTQMDYQEKQRLRARVARRLAGRGFGTETVYSVVRSAFEEREQELKEVANGV